MQSIAGASPSPMRQPQERDQETNPTFSPRHRDRHGSERLDRTGFVPASNTPLAEALAPAPPKPRPPARTRRWGHFSRRIGHQTDGNIESRTRQRRSPNHAAGLLRSHMAASVSMTTSVLPSAPYGLSDGGIWPKVGCASTAYAATAPWQLIFPWAIAHSSRGKKVPPSPSSALLRPHGVRRRSPRA